MPQAPEHPDPLRRLLEVMAVLRGKEGCPWDLRQTHQSLLPHLTEETYELIEAVETGGDADLREELGDVLLQVAFHSRIAEERGAFDFDDVAGALADKLVRRHGHVFGDERLESPEQVRNAWHEQKMATRDSALDGIPSAQPALSLARQVGARAARGGFEWEALERIFAKISEELGEIRAELPGRETPDGRKALENEVGDLLFAVVQLARWVEVDPEAAMRGATRKFMTRFQAMESTLKTQGRKAAELTSGDWWALWDKVKKDKSKS